MTWRAIAANVLYVAGLLAMVAGLVVICALSTEPTQNLGQARIVALMIGCMGMMTGYMLLYAASRVDPPTTRALHKRTRLLIEQGGRAVDGVMSAGTSGALILLGVAGAIGLVFLLGH